MRLREIAKLRSLRAIGLPSDLFQGYAPKLVERLRRRIAAESPSHIREHPQAIRMTLLAALVFQRSQEVTDTLVTLLIQLVHRIGKRAERRVEAAYLNDLKRVAGKTRILYRSADAALEHPDEPVREVVFPEALEQTLREPSGRVQSARGSLPATSAGSDAFLLSQPLSPDSASSPRCTRLPFQQHVLSTGGRGAGGGSRVC